MVNTDNIKFTKSEYTLRDFALFKLCPMLYACSVAYPLQAPASGEQLRLSCEAEILSDAFSKLVEYASDGKVYFKNTSLCLTDLVGFISDCLRDKADAMKAFTKHDMELITNGLYDKAEMAIADIHRRIKGARYTILGGVQKEYRLAKINFKYISSFTSADLERGVRRSICVDEYRDFPVFSAGKRHGRLIHYTDIMEALSGNDPLTDRVALAIKIIRKINIQIESGYYENDGLERISALGSELENYDFSRPEKKAGGFCSYCKYFDICRQNL